MLKIFNSKIYGINSNLSSFGNSNIIISQLLLGELANHILNFLNKSDEMGLSGENHQIDSLPNIMCQFNERSCVTSPVSQCLWLC